MTVPHQVDFVAASSYGLGTISSANVKIKKDTEAPIEGKMVLVVDEMYALPCSFVFAVWLALAS